MNNMKKWVRGTLAVGVAAGLVLLVLLVLLLMRLMAGEPVDAGGHAGGPALSGAGSSRDSASPKEGRVGAQAPLTLESPWSGPVSGASNRPQPSPLSTMSPPRFAADSRGKLVLNGDTHANLEKLLLQEDPEAMRATLEQVSKSLPAQAAADLKVLVSQFQQYSKALTHSISPENAPANEQEGVKLIDSLHTLRVSYLGAETTQAMFGEEEATTRQIIALMGADKDPNLTQEEKAERAQEVISKRRQAPPAG